MTDDLIKTLIHIEDGAKTMNEASFHCALSDLLQGASCSPHLTAEDILGLAMAELSRFGIAHGLVDL